MKKLGPSGFCVGLLLAFERIPLSQREREAKPGEGEKLELLTAFEIPAISPSPLPLSRWERGGAAGTMGSKRHAALLMSQTILLLLAMPLLTSPAFAADSVRLTTPVSGVVKTVFVEQGQRVRKGDKLLELNDVRYQAKLMEAEAGVMRAKLETEDAEKDLKRAEELYARGVSSTTELDAVKLRHVRASASLKEAQARQIIAQKNLDDTVLKAPFNGVVKSREAEPGMFVSAELNPPVLIVLVKTR